MLWKRFHSSKRIKAKMANPEHLKLIDNVQGLPIAHSYGRKDFYDQVTGRFWKFYSDGSNLKFTSTIEGVNWEIPQVIRNADNGYHFYVCYLNGTVHYIYNSEKIGANIYYRKGNQ